MTSVAKDKAPCGVEGCVRPRVAYGYCTKHAHRFIRHGDPLGGGAPHRVHGSDRPICKFEECCKPVLANGMCHTHNNRWNAQGRPAEFDGKTLKDHEAKPKIVGCAVDGCDRTSLYRGYCRLHYGRWLTHGDTGPSGLKIRRERKTRSAIEVWSCSVDGCCKDALVGTRCKEHYRESMLNTTHSAAMDAHEGRVGAYGYVTVRVQPDPCVSCGSHTLEHRLIMSLLLGRPLRSDENVHHKNGDRGDNRPSNLELWVKPQPCGQRVEDVIAWAKDILKRYRNFDKSAERSIDSPQLELILGGKSA